MGVAPGAAEPQRSLADMGIDSMQQVAHAGPAHVLALHSTHTNLPVCRRMHTEGRMPAMCKRGPARCSACVCQDASGCGRLALAILQPARPSSGAPRCGRTLAYPIPTTRSRKPGPCGAAADARRGRAGGGARAGAARARSALPARAGARSCACSRRAQQRSVCAMRVCAPVVSPPCVNEVWRTLHEPKAGAEKRGCGAGGCTDRGSAAGPACRHCGGRSRAPRRGGVRPEDRGGFAESNEVQKTWQSGSAQGQLAVVCLSVTQVVPN